MARGINKVIIVGNCGQDPETRYSAGGSAITNLSVATSDSWKDKQTGQTQERTEWHRIVFFNRLAEIAGEYLKKGSKVYVEGRLQTRKWQDQSGQDRYSTEIVASEMQMLDSRGEGAPGGGYGQQGGGQAPQQFAPQQPQQQPQQQQPQQQQAQQQPQQSQQQPQPAYQNNSAPNSGMPQKPAQPAYQNAPQQGGAQGGQPQQAPAAAPAPGMDSFDDDIPF